VKLGFSAYRAFQDKVLRRVFELTRYEVTEGWRICEVGASQFVLSINQIRVRWSRYITRMGGHEIWIQNSGQKS